MIGMSGGTDYDDYKGYCPDCKKIDPLDVTKDVYVLNKDEYMYDGYVTVEYPVKDGFERDHIKMVLYAKDGKDQCYVGYGEASGKLVVKLL